jgi:hypothetical protein
MKKEDYEHDCEWRRWKGYVEETRMRITRIRKRRIWRKRMFKDWEDYGQEKRRTVKSKNKIKDKKRKNNEKEI